MTRLHSWAQTPILPTKRIPMLKGASTVDLLQRCPSLLKGQSPDCCLISFLARRNRNRRCFSGRHSEPHMSAKYSFTGRAGLCSPARSRGHVCMATSQGIGMQASQTTQNQNEAVKAILFDMVMLFSVPQPTPYPSAVHCTCATPGGHVCSSRCTICTQRM